MRNHLSNNRLPLAELKNEGLPSLVASHSSLFSTSSAGSTALDSGVKEALNTCRRSGNLSEMLKLELKTKIQLRRLKNGEEMHFCEEKLSPQSKYELTPADLERRKILKERNKVSARKHRMKKKNEKLQLEKEIKLLSEKNWDLRQQIKELESVKNIYIFKVEWNNKIKKKNN